MTTLLNALRRMSVRGRHHVITTAYLPNEIGSITLTAIERSCMATGARQHFRWTYRVLCGLALVVLLAGCGIFPESSFDLAPESRIPRWFQLPPGASRKDLTVTLAYFSGTRGPNATFTLKTTDGKTLTKVKGEMRDKKPRQLDGVHAESGSTYPMYEVIVVNGITDIVEHRAMQPTFYMTDDPSVWARLTSAAAPR
jgi:hypothetical protein